MVANLGCAACHAGVSYAADGALLKDRAMLGMTNSSLNLEAYTQAIYIALRRHADSPKLLETLQQLFPETGWRERVSLRYLVLPLARSRLDELEALGRPTPFPNGSPGNTNGVAALKQSVIELMEGWTGIGRPSPIISTGWPPATIRWMSPATLPMRLCGSSSWANGP